MYSYDEINPAGEDDPSSATDTTETEEDFPGFTIRERNLALTRKECKPK